MNEEGMLKVKLIAMPTIYGEYKFVVDFMKMSFY